MRQQFADAVMDALVERFAEHEPQPFISMTGLVITLDFGATKVKVNLQRQTQA